jgi:diaminopimelate decarboxylase
MTTLLLQQMNPDDHPLLLTPILHPNIEQYIDQERDSIFDLLAAFGSPLHILFPEIMLENCELFQNILSKKEIDGKVYFACKANKSPSFLQMAVKAGIGIETSSIYELRSALANGITGNNIIVSGPVKTTELLLLAVLHDCVISVDNEEEIGQLKNVIDAQVITRPIRILVRINDVIDKQSRFGILRSILDTVYTGIENESRIKLLGFSFHINNYSPFARVQAIEVVFSEIQKARARGLDCDVIDIGGGFTIRYLPKSVWEAFQKLKQSKVYSNSFYNQKKPKDSYPYYSQYSKEKYLEKILTSKMSRERTVAELLREENIRLFLEPGRSLLDQCGITIMEVFGVREFRSNENIVIVNANINHLSEQWFNTDFLVDPILLTKATSQYKSFVAAIGGNLCLEMDMLSWRKIQFTQKPMKGDLLVYPNTAGYQMDSNESMFHQVPLPKKVVAFFTKMGLRYKTDDKFSLLDIGNVCGHWGLGPR